MVHSSLLAISADGERLTCDGFSLDETVRFESIEFIVDYHGGLSISPMINNSGAAFIDSTHSGPPSSLRAMIEDAIDEFYTASSGEGGLRPPLFQEAWYGDFVYPRHNYTMGEGHSDHLCHDYGSTSVDVQSA
jgi:hypothetical protein